MSAVADVLNGAADLIERDGWTQGAASCTNVGAPTCVGIAMDRIAVEMFGDETDPVYESALATFRSWIRHRSLIDWNDAPGRTKAEVVAALRAAAERAI